MRLTFLGATHEVTGSCFYLEVGEHKLLIDCGMEQGPDEFENQEIPVAASEIEAVLLTHAHIDHSGNLPLLYQRGFRGQIFTTEATRDLCQIMLRDSAHIQMFEAEWRNRKGRRAGKAEVLPLYDMNDAEGAIQCLVGLPYGKEYHVNENVRIRFVDAGHLLGSASIEVWVTEEGVEKKIVFSGDIGNKHQPLIRDPEYLKEADYVVMESTYGDRSHGPKPDYVKELAAIMQRTFDRGGNLVIPSFAVGRTQEMLYFIRKIKEDHLVKNHDGFQVFVDSPLALEATTIFQKHMWDDYDEEAMELVKKGINPIGFDGLRTSVTSDDSKNINFDPNPKVILSASGMCEAGRIKHHLKHNLWRPVSTVLFVGYQAVGAFEKKPYKVFVVHGDDSVIDGFAKLIHETFGLDAQAPYSGSVFDLKNGCWEKEEAPVRIKKPETRAQDAIQGLKANTPFARLLAAGQRLLTVIRHNEGGANKDLARFTSQINSLCDKWDR